MITPTVRPADIADLEPLVTLESLFPTDRISRASFRHFLTKAHAQVFVCEYEAQVVGNAIVTYRRGFHGARLYSLVVHPDLRGQGLGSRLLYAVEEAARVKACVSLRLEVREDNAPAIALYERQGFRTVARTADYYQDHSTALRMTKRLLPVTPPVLQALPYYPQSLDFTCGSAALMMAMTHLGYSEPFSRELELQLWREATTIFMMSGHGGSSAHGLALAALRRGYKATVFSRDNNIPFLDTVRNLDKKDVIALSHVAFLRDVVALGGETIIKDFGVDDVINALERGGVPILLISAYRLYGEKMPHWVVVTGYDASFLYLHDPHIPDDAERADGVHLPLARGDFERYSRFGKAKHRYMIVIEGSQALA